MTELKITERPEGCQAVVVYGGYTFTEPGKESMPENNMKQAEVTAVCGDRSFSFNRQDTAMNSWEVFEWYCLGDDAQALLGAMCLNCPNRQENSQET